MLNLSKKEKYSRWATLSQALFEKKWQSCSCYFKSFKGNSKSSASIRFLLPYSRWNGENMMQRFQPNDASQNSFVPKHRPCPLCKLRHLSLSEHVFVSLQFKVCGFIRGSHGSVFLYLYRLRGHWYQRRYRKRDRGRRRDRWQEILFFWWNWQNIKRTCRRGKTISRHCSIHSLEGLPR